MDSSTLSSRFLTVPFTLPYFLYSTTSSSSSTSSPSFSKVSSTVQSLSSIPNNPLSSTTITSPEFTSTSSTKSTSIFTRSDLNRIILKHSNNEMSTIPVDGRAGEALVACLREVPSIFFKQDFHLEEGATFRAACPFSTFAEKALLQEKLSQYLDVVEFSLVKEISLRSSLFFEAQGELLDLNGNIFEASARVRELRDTIRLIDSDLVESARQIQLLNSTTRTNLLALEEKLRLMSHVNQALTALKLLVASADCAGALDVTDDLQHLLDGDELTGLHCFRHLRDHVTGFIESINSILSAEFIRASLHDAAESDVIILSKAKSGASLPMNGKDEVKLEEETTNFKHILLPTVVGLLRTANLPSVLSIYRDTLTFDMEIAIESAVSELLPVLAARCSESTFVSGDRAVEADGDGASLVSKLRSLSSYCFVQLLSAIFMIVQDLMVGAVSALHFTL